MPSVYIGGNNNVATGTNLTGLNATTGVTIAWWQWGQPPTGGASPVSVGGTIFNQGSTANASRDGYCIGWNATSQLVSRIHDSTGTTATTAVTVPHIISGRWNHYIFSFDDATDQVVYYVNGKLWALQTNTRDMTANASCTCNVSATSVGGTTIYGYVFDLQIFPDIVVPQSDAQLLMDPEHFYPGCRGRYFGIDSRHFTTVVASGSVFDESGNGNTLTIQNALRSGPEPPFRFTIA